MVLLAQARESGKWKIAIFQSMSCLATVLPRRSQNHFQTLLEDNVLGYIFGFQTLFNQEHVVDGQADSWWTNISLFPLFSPIAIIVSAPGEVHQTRMTL